MTKLNLTADELLSTTRSVRKRLDLDRPVEDAVLRECLELALQAPSGSNAQNWQFVVVTDAARKKALGDIYRRAFDIYENLPQNAAKIYGGTDPARIAQQERVMESARYLADRMGDVPALLIPCLSMRIDGAPNIAGASMYGSVLPAAWSFCLAARERGLGTSWTSMHLMFEEEAADILGIPFAEVTQLALIAVAYTQGTAFKPARREPLDTVVHWNQW